MRRFEDGFWWEHMGRLIYAECDQCGYGVKRGSFYGARAAMDSHISRVHVQGSFVYTPPTNVRVIPPGEVPF